MVSTEGSWEAGVDGALPGIVMLANPAVGEAYRQEYSAGEAEDLAEIAEVMASASVPAGDFSEVLVIREWNPLEPDVVEEKYHAPGVGVVLELIVEGGEGRIELIEQSELEHRTTQPTRFRRRPSWTIPTAVRQCLLSLSFGTRSAS